MRVFQYMEYSLLYTRINSDNIWNDSSLNYFYTKYWISIKEPMVISPGGDTFNVQRHMLFALTYTRAHLLNVTLTHMHAHTYIKIRTISACFSVTSQI